LCHKQFLSVVFHGCCLNKCITSAFRNKLHRMLKAFQFWQISKLLSSGWMSVGGGDLETLTYILQWVVGGRWCDWMDRGVGCHPVGSDHMFEISRWLSSLFLTTWSLKSFITFFSQPHGHSVLDAPCSSDDPVLSFPLTTHSHMCIRASKSPLTFTLKVATAVFAKMENYQHSMWLIPKSQSGNLQTMLNSMLMSWICDKTCKDK
jgi:hypothetical protein